MLHALSRRLAPWAVPNLLFGLILCQVFVYVLSFVQPQVYEAIVFDREKILSGEVWRALTFLVTPPLRNPIFAALYWWCLNWFGSSVEAQFGAPRFNLYLLIGWVASVAVAMFVGGTANNGFLYGTVFLAFAQLFPEAEIYVYFLIPVKAKWLALLAWIGYTLAMVGGDWATRAMVLASLANFFAFFGGEMLGRYRASYRRRAFEGRLAATRRSAFHVCQVCGITDRTHPQMEFRYCSQCVGQRGYCSDHLRHHEHVVDPNAALRQPV